MFEYVDNVKRKIIKILDGLKGHTDVFNPAEKAIITYFVFKMQGLEQQKRLKV